MRCFKNIATLIRTKRMNHPKGYSQSELSNLLGYKNGQFISNVERALCNIPLKMLKRVCDVLDIHPDELKGSILKDHEETLNNYLRASSQEEAAVNVEETSSTYNESSASLSNSAAGQPAYKMTGTSHS
jgi:transcriptional regulator with XRE-family HTH domain